MSTTPKQERVASVHETEENINSAQDIIGSLREICGDDGTPATMENRESLLGPSSPSDQQHPTASNVQVGAFSITPAPQGGGDRPSSAGSDQGHVEVPLLTAEESMSPPRPNFDPNNQSLPLLEAVLVEDVPEEPVYDAFPLSDTQDNDTHGWSKISLKWRVVKLGSVLVAMAGIISAVVPRPSSGTVLNNVSEKNSACSLFFVDRDEPLSRLHSMRTFASQSTDPIMTSTTSTSIALTENSTTTVMNTVR
jgi:hypothetical protein